MDTNGNPTTPPMVDESLATDGRRTVLARIYRTDTDTIQVSVTRDPYDFQSSAVARVLNSDRNWTPLAVEPVDHWYPATCRAPDVAAHILREVADRLITRALIILG